jgi:hypothetical protein
MQLPIVNVADLGTHKIILINLNKDIEPFDACRFMVLILNIILILIRNCFCIIYDTSK